MKITCDWCGHVHTQGALCSKRPGLTRRNFIALFGAGVAGMVIAPLPPLEIGLIEPPVALDLEAFGKLTNSIWMTRYWPGNPAPAKMIEPAKWIEVPIIGGHDVENRKVNQQ